jgi:hypothetical protein
MTQTEKLIMRILYGKSDADIFFSDLCGLLGKFGFNERIKGSHHIFFKNGIDEIINLQAKDSKAKAYQVKQVRNIIIKYKLGGEDIV